MTPNNLKSEITKPNKMKNLSKLLTLIFAITLLSCGNNKKTENVVEEVVETPKSNMKIKLFNETENLLNKLSENGIGELKEWKNPEDMGWGSLTDYYQFGEQKDGVGMQNNLAYYLEGEENYAKNLLLNLNVNNPKSKKEAVKLFSETTETTFKTLEIEIPQGLLEAIKNGKDFKSENDNFTTDFKIENSNIDTYKMEIVSK